MFLVSSLRSDHPNRSEILLACLLLTGIAGLACGVCAATSYAGVGKVRSVSGALALVLSACAVACWTLPQGRVLAGYLVALLESPALVTAAALLLLSLTGVSNKRPGATTPGVAHSLGHSGANTSASVLLPGLELRRAEESVSL